MPKGFIAALPPEQRKRALAYRGDDTFGPVRLTGQDVKARVERRMATIDALSADQRELVHEFGWATVKQFMERGVNKPRDIRVLIETVLHELSPIGSKRRANAEAYKD